MKRPKTSEFNNLSSSKSRMTFSRSRTMAFVLSFYRLYDQMNKNLNERAIRLKRAVNHDKSSNALCFAKSRQQLKAIQDIVSMLWLQVKKKTCCTCGSNANQDQPIAAFQLQFADSVFKNGKFPHDENQSVFLFGGFFGESYREINISQIRKKGNGGEKAGKRRTFPPSNQKDKELD